jgi:hypothetical protein
MGIEVALAHAQTFVAPTSSGAERQRRRLQQLAWLEKQSKSNS